MMFAISDIASPLAKRSQQRTGKQQRERQSAENRQNTDHQHVRLCRSDWRQQCEIGGKRHLAHQIDKDVCKLLAAHAVRHQRDKAVVAHAHTRRTRPRPEAPNGGKALLRRRQFGEVWAPVRVSKAGGDQALAGKHTPTLEQRKRGKHVPRHKAARGGGRTDVVVGGAAEDVVDKHKAPIEQLAHQRRGERRRRRTAAHRGARAGVEARRKTRLHRHQQLGHVGAQHRLRGACVCQKVQVDVEKCVGGPVAAEQHRAAEPRRQRAVDEQRRRQIRQRPETDHNRALFERFRIEELFEYVKVVSIEKEKKKKKRRGNEILWKNFGCSFGNVCVEETSKKTNWQNQNNTKVLLLFAKIAIVQCWYSKQRAYTAKYPGGACTMASTASLHSPSGACQSAP